MLPNPDGEAISLMAKTKQTDRLQSCSKCGTSTGKLNQCESGFVCDSCIDAYRAGRDETTKIVRATKVVTLARQQVPEPVETSIPHSTELTVPPEPAQPIQQVTPEIVTRDASTHRTELLTYLGNECASLALGLEIDMKPKNRVEQMLLDLMAVSYKMALETSSKGFLAADPADQTRLLNLSARMAENFQKGALTLQRLQSGGNQQIIVQHVTVAQGGQAVVGNVHTGGAA